MPFLSETELFSCQSFHNSWGLLRPSLFLNVWIKAEELKASSMLPGLQLYIFFH